MLCPHCKKGEMREKSIVMDMGSSVPGRTDLICDLCFHREVQMNLEESINIHDSVERKKS